MDKLVSAHPATGTATLFRSPTKSDATMTVTDQFEPSGLTGTATVNADALSMAGVGSNEKRILRERFAHLLETWRNETGMYSIDTKKVAHPAYLKIIGMGNRAVPLILADMKEHGGHWIQALEAILGYDPINVSGAISMRELHERWLDWGKRQGYIF